MVRAYIKKGHTVEKPNGVKVIYAPGHYNLDDGLARELLARGKAHLVDHNDNPDPDKKLDLRYPQDHAVEDEEI
jgi:hypothetical protein